MKTNKKPGKGNKAKTNNNTPAAAPENPATPATPKSEPKPEQKPETSAGKNGKGGGSKLQILTTDLTGKTDWTNRFVLAIRGEGDQFLPGWSVTQFLTKEARDAEIAILSKGIDKVETRVNKPVTLNGKQVFFLRWKGGYRDEAKA